jgi:hypothetical protein
VTYELARSRRIDGRVVARPIAPARVDAFDHAYVMLADGVPSWQVILSWGEHAAVPFREEAIWPAAQVAVIGGGGIVHFLDLETGASRHQLELPCRFGHLALADDTLFILGWTDLIAIERTLDTRWWARDVAVDGIVFDSVTGPFVRIAAEMDPPGGWFDVTLDAATGREIARHPAFSDDYAGIYATDT